MAHGWKLTYRRPNPDGGSELQGIAVVHVGDKFGAIAVAASKMPDAAFTISSEASAEMLEDDGVEPGQMLVLIEGH